MIVGTKAGEIVEVIGATSSDRSVLKLLAKTAPNVEVMCSRKGVRVPYHLRDLEFVRTVDDTGTFPIVTKEEEDGS